MEVYYSIFFPYLCGNCGYKFMNGIENGKDKPDNIECPKCKCKKCNSNEFIESNEICDFIIT